MMTNNYADKRTMYVVTNDKETVEKLFCMGYELYFHTIDGTHYFFSKPEEKFDKGIEDNICYSSTVVASF